jgi:hypothetical protein
MVSSIEEKLNLSLKLVNYNPHQGVIWGSGGIFSSFLTSTLDGSKWSASRLCDLTREKNPPVPIL